MLEEILWYPKKKIEIVRKKLMGEKSSKIMLEELTDTRHLRSQHYNMIKEAVAGGKGTLRHALKHVKDNLKVIDQVDILIDHARDPNLLGRTWIGWGPYL